MKRIIGVLALAVAAMSLVVSSESIRETSANDKSSRKSEAQERSPQVERKLSARITAAQAKHIVAYYFKEQDKLIVYNQKALATGMKQGVYHLTWKPGATRAMLSMPVSNLAANGRYITAIKQVPVGVAYMASSRVLEGTEPKVGDTMTVNYAKKYDHAGYEQDCDAPLHFSPRAPKNSKAIKRVHMGYTYLDDDGDQSGQETYTAVDRVNFYGLKDCSAGYLGFQYNGYAWVLSSQAWPNP